MEDENEKSCLSKEPFETITVQSLQLENTRKKNSSDSNIVLEAGISWPDLFDIHISEQNPPPKGHCQRPVIAEKMTSSQVMFTDQIMELHIDYSRKRTKYHCHTQQRLPHLVAGACAAKDQNTNLVYVMGGRNASRFTYHL